MAIRGQAVPEDLCSGPEHLPDLAGGWRWPGRRRSARRAELEAHVEAAGARGAGSAKLDSKESLRCGVRNA